MDLLKEKRQRGASHNGQYSVCLTSSFLLIVFYGLAAVIHLVSIGMSN